MGNEAASRLAIEAKTDEYGFAVIETASPVIKTIHDIIAMGISQVAMVTITLHFDSATKTRSTRQESSEQTSMALLSVLRKMVRRTDSVFLLDNTMIFLLLSANVQGGEIVQTRLWDALLWRMHNTAEGELLRPQSMQIGHSAYPAPCPDMYELLAVASQPSLRFEFYAEKQLRKQLSQQTQQQVDEDELSSLARKLGIPYLSLLPRKPSHRVQQLVSPQLAQELRCYPIGRERNMLTVAMQDPQDQSALVRLQRETGLSIFPVLTHPQELQTALEQLL